MSQSWVSKWCMSLDFPYNSARVPFLKCLRAYLGCKEDSKDWAGIKSDKYWWLLSDVQENMLLRDKLTWKVMKRVHHTIIFMLPWKECEQSSLWPLDPCMSFVLLIFHNSPFSARMTYCYGSNLGHPMVWLIDVDTRNNQNTWSGKGCLFKVLVTVVTSMSLNFRWLGCTWCSRLDLVSIF